MRVRTGAHKGELAWMPLTHWRVLRTLHNPRYAGAFAYGRRRERVTADGKKTFDTLPREQWIALIPDAHPGYVDWEQFETNQRLLSANATARGEDRAAGPAREGTALLQGLAVCAKCGNRMTVRYHTRRGVEVPDYQCIRTCIQDGGRRCQGVPGAAVDAAIGQLLLDTVTPLALEVALTVQTELETRAAEADALRRGQVERARHRADLARRRYLAVDPDNRLVADSLEADWNDALRTLGAAREDYERASAAAATALTEEVQAKIRSLATDFPALWANPDTPQRDRKRMVRLLVADVTLHKTDRIHLHVRRPDPQPHRGNPAESLATPPDPPRHPRRPRPAPRHLHRRRDRRRAQRRRSPLRRGQSLHRPHSPPCPPQQQPAQPCRPAPCQGPAHQHRTRHTTRCAPQHDQKLDTRRNPQLTQSKRQKRAALRATHPRRPTPHHPTRQPAPKTSSHPTRARRCTMKPSPCPNTPRCGPSNDVIHAGCRWIPWRRPCIARRGRSAQWFLRIFRREPRPPARAHR
ncbi:MAG: hypothetical protein EOP32_39070 [Rhodococcus sp. (in: high G+C Gram-positive bacteria)]|nr:MAG: hypothetical protein EOP32_39070 [Rhodococcus sp. (in: high G+C Gram-positive bacteria)]